MCLTKAVNYFRKKFHHMFDRFLNTHLKLPDLGNLREKLTSINICGFIHPPLKKKKKKNLQESYLSTLNPPF